MEVQSKSNQLRVKVGTPWPEDIQINSCIAHVDKRAKTTILLGFAGLVTFLLIAFTIYGWLYSEEIFKEVFSLVKYILLIVIGWATGSQFSSKAIDDSDHK